MINEVCAVAVDGRNLVASCGGDGTARLWDTGSGTQHAVLEDRHHWIDAICAVKIDGRDLIASGGDDGTVRLWDPHTGRQLTVLDGHHDPIYRAPDAPNGHQCGVLTMCAVTVDGRNLLASGGGDETVRLWDP